VLRAEVGGPGVWGMPLGVTIRTAVSSFGRQVGLQLVVLLFIRNASRKAKQSTTSSSSALKGKLGIRLVKFACYSIPPVPLASFRFPRSPLGRRGLIRHAAVWCDEFHCGLLAITASTRPPHAQGPFLGLGRDRRSHRGSDRGVSFTRLPCDTIYARECQSLSLLLLL
jgi:hypothetical protein